ncbi:MAG: hypothetical protein AB1646_26290, partial [Thermodesulfobacteriota bacterium]
RATKSTKNAFRSENQHGHVCHPGAGCHFSNILQEALITFDFFFFREEIFSSVALGERHARFVVCVEQTGPPSVFMRTEKGGREFGCGSQPSF